MPTTLISQLRGVFLVPFLQAIKEHFCEIGQMLNFTPLQIKASKDNMGELIGWMRVHKITCSQLYEVLLTLNLEQSASDLDKEAGPFPESSYSKKHNHNDITLENWITTIKLPDPPKVLAVLKENEFSTFKELKGFSRTDFLIMGIKGLSAAILEKAIV